MLETIATGLGFGAALVASGMYSPYLIASQFTMQKWNMVQTFLTATGCSACVFPCSSSFLMSTDSTCLE